MVYVEEEDTTSTSSSPGYDKPGADVDVELTKENVIYIILMR